MSASPAATAPASPRWPRDAKRGIADATFTAELSRLARLFARADFPALAGVAEADLHDVLVELLAAFERVPGLRGTRPAAAASSAAGRRRRRGRGPATLPPAAPGPGRGVRRAARPGRPRRSTRPRQAARDELVVRFGRPRGPVLAKGVEDTAFYRWPRLAALNEVGGDPAGSASARREFHARGQHAWRPAGRPP